MNYYEKVLLSNYYINEIIITSANIISNRIRDKDWSIANGKLTDNALVALNTGGSFSAITIAFSIKLDQLLYLFIIVYITVKHLK